MEKKKNILHVNNSSALSQYLLSIARNYDKEKYNLTIGCFDKYGPLNKTLDEYGINNFHLPAHSLPAYLWQSIRFFFLLKKLRVDILHVHTFYPSFFGVIIGRLAGIKTIVLTRHHANQHVKLNKKIHIGIDSWTARKADKVIAVSEFTKQVMVTHEKVPAEKIRVIHNGLEPLRTTGKNKEWICRELQIPSQTFVFLCISRFFREKNIACAVRAIHELNNKGYPSILLIAGAGLDSDYFREIQREIVSLNLGSKIFCLGFRNDVGDLLHASDALIHASFEESFGFAALEALWAGKPVIASDIPAIREVVTDEIAYLFDPHKPAELTARVLEWIAMPAESERRVRKGLERYKNYFTFKVMMEKYERYYEE